MKASKPQSRRPRPERGRTVRTKSDQVADVVAPPPRTGGKLAKGGGGTRRISDDEAQRLADLGKRALVIINGPGNTIAELEDLATQQRTSVQTLYRLAKARRAFRRRLAAVIKRLGTAKLYVLTYHPDPASAYDEGIVIYRDGGTKGASSGNRRVEEMTVEGLRGLIRMWYPEHNRPRRFRKKYTHASLRAFVGRIEVLIERLEYRVAEWAAGPEDEDGASAASEADSIRSQIRDLRAAAARLTRLASRLEESVDRY